MFFIYCFIKNFDENLDYLSTTVIHSYHVLLQYLSQLVVVTDVTIHPVNRGRIQVQKVTE